MVKKVRRKRQDPEHQIQKAYFQAIELYPNIRACTFAVPNGGPRNIFAATKLKAEGVTKGVCDVICLIPSEPYHGLVIEFKHGKNKLTKEQVDFSQRIQSEGYKFLLMYDWKEAFDATINYIQGRHNV